MRHGRDRTIYYISLSVVMVWLILKCNFSWLSHSRLWLHFGQWAYYSCSLEIHVLLFPSFAFNVLLFAKYYSKPLWDVIAYLVSNVPLPTPGKDRVLFAIENCLFSVEAPPKDWLPHADVRTYNSFAFLSLVPFAFSSLHFNIFSW